MRTWQMQTKPKQDIKRIVGGYDTPNDEAPYYVRILSCTNGADCGLCGATWISQTTILTAAHCVVSESTEMYYYLNPSNNAYNEAFASVASWVTHECWDEKKIWDNGFDIALLTVDNLAKSVEVIRLAEAIDYSNLPTGYPSNVNDFVSYGFGRTDGEGNKARWNFFNNQYIFKILISSFPISFHWCSRDSSTNLRHRVPKLRFDGLQRWFSR